MPGRTNKRKPPRGLVVNHDDLAALASQSSQAEAHKAFDSEIVNLKRQVCTVKNFTTSKQSLLSQNVRKLNIIHSLCTIPIS